MNYFGLFSEVRMVYSIFSVVNSYLKMWNKLLSGIQISSDLFRTS